MKMNQNRHDLTQPQFSCPLALFATILHEFPFPERQKNLAKIIYTHKQFE
jgi:hypothetical protein